MKAHGTSAELVAPVVAINVFHVSPDNSAYVGPYTEQEARAALAVLPGFTHYPAEGDQEESWQCENVGGSQGVSLSIEPRDKFDYPPEKLSAAIFDEAVVD